MADHALTHADHDETWYRADSGGWMHSPLDSAALVAGAVLGAVYAAADYVATVPDVPGSVGLLSVVLSAIGLLGKALDIYARRQDADTARTNELAATKRLAEDAVRRAVAAEAERDRLREEALARLERLEARFHHDYAERAMAGEPVRSSADWLLEADRIRKEL